MSKFNLDFTSLYEQVKEFIENNQGDKGYINVQNDDCDTIYAVVYTDDYTMYDARVKGVRVAHDQIEIVYELDSLYTRIVWSDDDFKNADEDEWEPIYWSETVHFIPTLVSIADAIEQYI